MVTNEERAQRYADAVYDIAVDHPMWIDADSQPLDYNPRREEMLIEFIDEAQAAVIALADAEQAELRADLAYAQADARHWHSGWGRADAELRDARAALVNMDRLVTEANAAAESAEAKVARVEALMPPDLELIEAGYWVLASDLRAALDGDA